MELTDKKAFDEKAKEALELLFENFWILRESAPEQYQLIREREHILRRYITEKFGYRLIVHRYFIKLEKIPAAPESWMGIQAFKSTMDYALFSCLLSFLENKSVDDQFLLSELCEELQALYPGMVSLDWTNYEHRKSLIRVLQTAKEFKIIKVIDGEITSFQSNGEEEVLYEVPVISRYFMRSYPKDLFQYGRINELLEQEWVVSPAEARRHKVYRKLFLSPATYRESEDDSDFAYIRNFRNRLREDIEEHTDYRLELYKNAALITSPENKMRLTLFPDQKAIIDIIMQFSAVLRNYQLEFAPDELGVIRLTEADMDRLIKECKEKYDHGWSKAYRDASLSHLKNDCFSAMNEWKMADKDAHTDMYRIYPLLGRITGEYPADFTRSGK